MAILFLIGRWWQVPQKKEKGCWWGDVWFPKYETTRALLESTEFTDLDFLHYYDTDGTPVLSTIDYSKCLVGRTPAFDERVSSPRRPMSIVVDCRK